mgnify:CR=1 FL=1
MNAASSCSGITGISCAQEKVRWGVIGTGMICQDFVRALGSVPEAEVVAVGSRSIDSANKFGDEFKVAKRYSSYDEVARDADVKVRLLFGLVRVSLSLFRLTLASQVVYIGTLHHLHKENMISCITNGKHVLCEKPFTLNRSVRVV